MGWLTDTLAYGDARQVQLFGLLLQVLAFAFIMAGGMVEPKNRLLQRVVAGIGVSAYLGGLALQGFRGASSIAAMLSSAAGAILLLVAVVGLNARLRRQVTALSILVFGASFGFSWAARGEPIWGAVLVGLLFCLAATWFLWPILDSDDEPRPTATKGTHA